MAIVSTIGNIIGGNKQAKAAKKAADVSLEVAQENNALAREIYGENKSALQPYQRTGNVAGAHLNALLGLDTRPPEPQQSTAPNAFQAPYSTGGYAGFGGGLGFDWPQTATGQSIFGPPPNVLLQNTVSQNQQPANDDYYVSPDKARDSFRKWIDNSDYAFQFGEGSNAVNSGYAGAGTLNSGAAMKAMEDYRQNLQEGYRGEYNSLLANQQSLGLGASSALAGVGGNYVNNVTANNNAAGSAAANALLAKGAAQANTYRSIGDGVSQAIGIFAGGGF